MSSVINAMTNTSNEFSQAIADNANGSDLDKDAFMLLLVTQFQYQDPLNPMEDKEFIAQLAQFSSLEQLMTLNESMNTLSAVTHGQEMVNATSYMGKTVDVTGRTISKTTNESGEIMVTNVTYAIGETAAKAQMNIIDANGDIVNSYALPPLSAGTQPPFVWDGMNYSGTPAPDGVYEIYPSFTNADGQPIVDYDMVVEGVVSGVVTDNGVTYLSLTDGRVTPLSEVRRVSELTTVSSGDTGTDGDPDPTDTTEPTTP